MQTKENEQPQPTSERETLSPALREHAATGAAEAIELFNAQEGHINLHTVIRAFAEDIALLAKADGYAEGRQAGVQAWQPIETAPKDGSQIVALHEEGVDLCSWHEAQADAPDDMGHDAGWFGLAYSAPGRSFGNPKYFREAQGQPTHWKPLPDPSTAMSEYPGDARWAMQQPFRGKPMSDERPEGLSLSIQRDPLAISALLDDSQREREMYHRLVADIRDAGGWRDVLLLDLPRVVREQSTALARLREALEGAAETVRGLAVKHDGEPGRQWCRGGCPACESEGALADIQAVLSGSPVSVEAGSSEAEVTRLREERDRLLEALGTIQRTTFSGHGMSEDYRSGNHDAHVTCARWATAALSSPSASEKSPKAV